MALKVGATAKNVKFKENNKNVKFTQKNEKGIYKIYRTFCHKVLPFPYVAIAHLHCFHIHTWIVSFGVSAQLPAFSTASAIWVSYRATAGLWVYWVLLQLTLIS